MRIVSLVAPAKINLYLEIVGDRPDGFHELVMVLQSIALADRVDLRASGLETIRVHCDHPEVPDDQRNLAYRAAALMTQQFADDYRRYGGFDITITKHIPVGAGLAGGSGNAAAVLVGIDMLWNLGLTQAELQDLAAQIGSDIPFCVSGGTALATGRGEVLDPLPALDHLYVVLAKHRSLSVSTPWAYQTYRQQFGDTYVKTAADWEKRRHEMNSGPMMTAILQRDGAAIGKYLTNSLERVVLPAHPQVARLREAFQKLNPLGVMMSGSGPTVFALAESQAQAETMATTVREALADPDVDFWVTRFNPMGIQLAAESETPV